MFKSQVEDSAAKVVAIGAFVTTIMVGAWWGTDPVNVPKLFTLSITAMGAFALYLVGIDKWNTKRVNFLSLCVALFISLALVSTIFSTETISISFYGVFGRNNGFLSYASFAILFFVVTQFNKLGSLNLMLRAFYAAGLVNVAYCALSISGIELIPWNNIFNTILGTFGNPNFVGAFLGMFASYLFNTLLSKEFDLKFKIFNGGVLILTMFEIMYSNAVQGIVVAGFGILITLFCYIRANLRSKFVLTIYSLSALLFSVLSALGALQIGPLTKFIYKTSVSLRGEYWQAGIKMGLDHPLLGVGMDSYGAWYRQTRDESAMILPGAGTTTNAAHNVVIDIFASGGFPLLVTYLAILGLILLSIIKVFRGTKKFDFTFVALLTVWFGFQAQSIISINQIGLAVWGWIFGGAIIAYERISKRTEGDQNREISNNEKAARKKISKQEWQPSSVLATFIGVLVGGLIALPPLAADVSWRSALGSGSQEQLEKTLIQFPRNPTRLAEGIQIFNQNNLPDVARKYALILIEEYPDNFISWGAYSQLSDLTTDEKTLILENLKKLDPLNPKFRMNE